MHRHNHGNVGQTSKTAMIMVVKIVTTGCEDVFDALPRAWICLKTSRRPPYRPCPRRPRYRSGAQRDYRLCKPVVSMIYSQPNQLFTQIGDD